MTDTTISQIGVVVRDLDKTMKLYTELLGWGPWNVYEHTAPILHDTHLHGKPATYSMLCAETMVGDMCYELIQPLEGDSIYKEWLEEHGEGLHHVAVMKPTQADSDEFKKKMAENGAEMLMGGRIGENIEFFYLDSEPNLKVILESGTGHAIDLKPVRVYPEPE
ncbi:VOC family protein [Roseovarius sp. MMSF_3281]|uniref:VOC family protein n=1 Tax=Roseovarius sp. MMSF_3281 TaxID=3046694 RepID=UPI00273D1384|nr:VOC family protein [Roseovarius sp. MMSF_3281]